MFQKSAPGTHVDLIYIRDYTADTYKSKHIFIIPSSLSFNFIEELLKCINETECHVVQWQYYNDNYLYDTFITSRSLQGVSSVLDARYKAVLPIS